MTTVPSSTTTSESTAGPLPEGATEVPADDTLCVTVDDDENVLELIYSNADGIYVRDTGEWTLVDTDIDQPTIDDQFWVDVTPDFVAVFDGMMQTEDGLLYADVAKYAAPQG